MSTESLHGHIIRLTAGTAETALNNLTPQTLAALRVNAKAIGALLARLESPEGANVIPLHPQT